MSTIAVRAVASVRRGFKTLSLVQTKLRSLSETHALFSRLRGSNVSSSEVQLLLTALRGTYSPSVTLDGLISVVGIVRDRNGSFAGVVTSRGSFIQLVAILNMSSRVNGLVQFHPRLIRTTTGSTYRDRLCGRRRHGTRILGSMNTSPGSRTVPATDLPLTRTTATLHGACHGRLTTVVTRSTATGSPVRVRPHVDARLSSLTSTTLRNTLTVTHRRISNDRRIHFTVVNVNGLNTRRLGCMSSISLVCIIRPTSVSAGNVTLDQVNAGVTAALRHMYRSIVVNITRPAL